MCGRLVTLASRTVPYFVDDKSAQEAQEKPRTKERRKQKKISHQMHDDVAVGHLWGLPAGGQAVQQQEHKAVCNVP